MFEMLAGRSPFDIVGSADNPDQNTEDYLFQGLFLTYIFSKSPWLRCIDTLCVVNVSFAVDETCLFC